MKLESKLFLWGMLPFLPVALIYGLVTQWREPVGVVGIGLLSAMSGMVGVYLLATGRKLPPRPEDDPNGEIAAQEGDYGFFSPGSWWPLPLAASSALLFLGLAVGWWLFVVGLVLGIYALIGWTFEYFQGPHTQ